MLRFAVATCILPTILASSAAPGRFNPQIAYGTFIGIIVLTAILYYYVGWHQKARAKQAAA